MRGVDREILRRIELEQEALHRGTGQEGTAWVDARGRVVAEFRVESGGVDGPTAEMEILRGDLARLPHEPARERAAFRFGDSVERIDEDGGAATVAFASGKVERHDAVIVAEGVGSTTRERVSPAKTGHAGWTSPSRSSSPRAARLTTACGAGSTRPGDGAFLCGLTSTGPRGPC